MKIRKIYFLALSLLGLGFGSCSDDSIENDKTEYTDALVTSFNLANNDSVMSDLASVFFTIDQYGQKDAEGNLVGQIFNADSLPVGSKTDRLLAEISFSAPESVTLYTASDTMEYSATDSIDFSSPVLMKVVAANGINTKYYNIKVNVHQVIGDTIEWKQYVANPLADAGVIRQQKAVSFSGDLYWYVQNATAYALYTAPQSDLKSWTKGAVAVPAGSEPVLSSLKSFSNSLYMVSAQGELIGSSDGTNWNVSSNAFVFKNLIGVLSGVNGAKDQLIAIVDNSGVSTFAYSTDAVNWTLNGIVPADFPVKGFSDAVQYFGGTLQRIVIVGGQTADGSLTASTWSYDGVNPWAEFKQKYLPAVQGATLITYQTDPRYANTFWMLIGGETATTGNGTFTPSIYYSYDKGVSWKRVSDNLSFPKAYAARAFCSVYVGSDYYINLLGGLNAEGEINQIWRGRLNQLAFTPVE
ncbi:MAG: DUF6242 domain-containing protein [Bacteroidales bacterium]